MAANDKQVGGQHYAATYQHWDWAWDTGMGYLPGSITKYVSRWRKKNGLQDLQKALHFAEKYYEVLYKRNVELRQESRSTTPAYEMTPTMRFILAQGITNHTEASIMWQMGSAIHDYSLASKVIANINVLIKTLESEPTPAYVNQD